MAKKSSYRVPPRTYIGYGKPPPGLVKKKQKKSSKHDDFTMYVILALIGGMVYVQNGIVPWIIYIVIVMVSLMIRNTRRKGADGSVS